MDPYITHYPILAAAVSATYGPVLECGMGFGSTPMLHYMCGMSRRFLLSADTDKQWIEEFRSYASPRHHELSHVEDWMKWPRLTQTLWSVAFVDCAPGEVRHEIAAALKGSANYIVLHDSETDYAAGGNYQYDKIKPLFKYVNEFRRLRPYTLVVSDFMEFNMEPADRTWTPPK